MRAVPQFRRHRSDYDPATLICARTIGDCLEPDFPDSTLMWFARGAMWKSGEICMLRDPRDAWPIIKQVTRSPDGLEWLLLSNLPATRMGPCEVVGPLAASVRFEGWSSAFPELTAASNAQNAEFRELAQKRLQELRSSLHAATTSKT